MSNHGDGKRLNNQLSRVVFEESSTITEVQKNKQSVNRKKIVNLKKGNLFIYKKIFLKPQKNRKTFVK